MAFRCEGWALPWQRRSSRQSASGSFTITLTATADVPRCAGFVVN